MSKENILGLPIQEYKGGNQPYVPDVDMIQ